MMIFFNKVGSSWVAKVIFTALGLSMIAFWGLGGISLTGARRNDALSVGNQSVSMKQLETAFLQERRNMSALMGGQFISPEQAIQMGVLDTVVASKVRELVNAGIREELGLAASNVSVQKYVEKNPVFADNLGNFDKNLFYAYLRQNNLTESQLAQRLQDELSMNHLAYAVKSLAYSPEVLVKTAYKHKNEKRNVTAVLIEKDKIKLTEKPTNDDLKDYYEAYAEQFMMPEYRTFSIMHITPDIVKQNIQITDAEIDAVYDDYKDNYTTPEKRDVAQMRFDDKETATGILKGLTADNFEKTASEKLNQNTAQTNFGYVSRDELLESLTEPVFMAKAGDIIGPVQSPLGWHILLVRGIQPATSLSEKQIRSNIRDVLINEKTYDTMYETVKNVEDILGAGDSLERAAEQTKIAMQKNLTVDVSGMKKNGQELDASINNPELVRYLFTINEQESTPVIEQGTGYVVAQLDEITPVAQREFADVRSELIQLWENEKKSARIHDLTQELVSSVSDGTSLAEKGVAKGFKVIREKGITRSDFGQIPVRAVVDIFAENENSVVQTSVGKDILIAVTDKIIYPELKTDDSEYETQRIDLWDVIGEEMLGATVDSYAQKFGVVIHDADIQKAFSVYINNK